MCLYRSRFFYFNPSRSCLPIFKYPNKYTPPILNKVNTEKRLFTSSVFSSVSTSI